MADFNKLVKTLKAAGEVTRLRLLALLAAGELSVKDLTSILGQSQPRVSRHLKLLAEAGLIQRNAEGAWVYYRLANEGNEGDLVTTLLAQIETDEVLLLKDRMALEDIQSKHQRQADRYFSQVAQSWDILRKLHVPEAAVESAILRVVGPKRIKRLLDLGTGTGRMLELLANAYSHGVGIDSSREMIGVARAKLASTEISHAQVRLGDILKTDLLEEPADLIVLHQVLHYFDDPGQVLIAARQNLEEEGGRVLIVDFSPHDLEFLRARDAHRRLGLSQSQMQLWATAADLKVDVYEEFINEAPQKGLVVCLWMLSSLNGREKYDS